MSCSRDKDDSGEKSPREFFGWFEDCLKEEKVFSSSFFYSKVLY